MGYQETRAAALDGPPAELHRLLVIEDSPSDAAMLRVQFDEASYAAAEIVVESTLADGLRRLATERYDAVLLDLNLPDSDGIDTFDQISRASGPAAIVVLTGLDDERLAVDAVHRGAQDFLVKGTHRPGELPRAVDHAIRRQRLLDDLRRARDEQLAAKDRFLSHVSHELRSPLSVVHQFASLLLDGIAGSLSEEQREFLGILMRNVGQLRVMIDDLLEVSRVQRGRVAVRCETVDVARLLRESLAAYRLTAEHRQVGLSLDVEELPVILADPERVREVLANVLDNAMRFTPGKGQISVTATRHPDGVCVTVRDTGRGIRREDLERVFEQFYQVNQSDEVSRNGLGLGLYVSRDLIERQGGAMWAESIFGHGTAVSFTLPTTGRRPDREAGQ